MQSRKALALFVEVLALSVLACSTGTPRKLNLYPSPTREATQTPILIEITTTPMMTSTTVFVKITTTPKPTIQFCVSASEAVYLRPSPNVDNYPVTQLPNGTKVVDLGGRNKDWLFVQSNEFSGWVNKKYLTVCN